MPGEEIEQSPIEVAKNQLVDYRRQLVGIFQNPPRGFDIETVNVPWTSKKEQTQEFSLDVPNKEYPEVVNKYRISFIRAKRGPDAQGIMITDAETKVTSSGDGQAKGWGETILPDGSLSGYQGSQEELSKLGTMIVKCGEILEVLGEEK
ncbi:hypothetical protein ISS42_00745 [Candidatus Shapirobacteria bacterium]|nr:hypothetical protein [Candidatus Shapirobacteria bacterium]